MATYPEEVSRESSSLASSEDLRESLYASSSEGSGDGSKGRRRSLRAVVLLTDAAVLVLSLGHLTLLILLMCYHGRAVDASYDVLQSILTTIGPIFPMVFSFILMGSRTVGSAVATHFELRAFNMLGLWILFVWVFSPVGGQSFLRVLDVTYPLANTSLLYMNTRQSDHGFYNSSFKDPSYISAFYSSDSGRPGPSDPWGNIKIPLLDVDSNSNAWHDIDHDTASYSAFVGLPIVNVSVGNSTFYLESLYLELNCDRATSHALDKNTQSFLEAETPISEIELDDARDALPLGDGGWKRTWPVTEGGTFVNGSWYGYQHARSQDVMWNIAIDRFIDKFWLTAASERHSTNPNKYDYYGFPSMGAFENETAIEAGPTYLLFQARRNVTLVTDGIYEYKIEVVSVDVQKAKCLVLQKYVESRVTCSRAPHESTADCKVVSQRPSQKPHPSENLSILSHPYVFAYLSKKLPTTLVTSGVSDPTLWSISDQPEPHDGEGLNVPDFTNISTSQLSRGLTKVINSYLLVNQADKDLLPRQVSSLFPLLDFENREYFKYWSLASAETIQFTRVFCVSWPWMTACFASCGVLAVCGIMGIILVHRGNSPEVLGFVSAIVRDSRYIKIPTDLEHMNGEDISRRLKSERLRYGYTSFESRGTPQMGIGRETEITKVEG
ncbi:unnamed protein product [Clonostachys rhizophaga]|uniref:Uncharacterized protein n=1 Tax=Clonostachys rhizophaga TaxID=160324 RepID=A0A9N9W1Z5_9HYPO|nr:unnamed protein product [Clonostachys rhizophaga]